jgi:hypothetical protein
MDYIVDEDWVRAMSPRKVSWALTTKRLLLLNRCTDRFDFAEDIVYVAWLNKTFVEIFLIHRDEHIRSLELKASGSQFKSCHEKVVH